MTPVENLLEMLEGVRSSGNGWMALCPAHDDSSPSLSIGQGEDGRALVKCFRGCPTEDIVAAVGLTMADLFLPNADTRPEIRPKPHKSAHLAEDKPRRCFANADEAVKALENRLGKHSGSWTYRNQQGDPVGLILRWDIKGKKVIRPVSRRGDSWIIGAMAEPRPLYSLPEVMKADRVIVVEGEKAADAARSLGFVATTSSGGSQAPKQTDWQPLAGKEVWILPDHDAPGQGYATTVSDILHQLNPPAKVKVIVLPDLPNKGDIVDWIAAQGNVDSDVLREQIEAMAEAVEPTESDNIVSNDLRFRPFPVHLLPEPLRAFVVEGARAIGCDPSYLALPLLVVLASAIGNTRRLFIKQTWQVPPILWGVVVGESGTTKSPAYKAVMLLIRDRQQKAMEQYTEEDKHYRSRLAQWEKEHAQWKHEKKGSDNPPEKPEPPTAKRSIVIDTTVEALAPLLSLNCRGLLLAMDELGGWLGSFDRYAGKGKSGSDSANWLSMYNAECLTVDRKSGIPPTIHVPHAAVCIIGTIQPGILRRALGQEHRESGLAYRMLIAHPPRTPKRWTEEDIHPETVKKMVGVFNHLYSLQMEQDEQGKWCPRVVRLSPDAKVEWTTYYNAHAKEQNELTGDMAGAWSKLEEVAARLALVIHLARCAANATTVDNEDIVDAESMRIGIKLTEWFKHEARRFYAFLDEEEGASEQRRLLEWIDCRGGTTTVRDVQRSCSWLKQPGVAEKALEELVREGQLRREMISPPKGGRPSIAYVRAKLAVPDKTLRSEGATDYDAGAAAAPSIASTRSTIDETLVLKGKNEVSSIVDRVDSVEMANDEEVSSIVDCVDDPKSGIENPEESFDDDSITFLYGFNNPDDPDGVQSQ